MEDFIYDRIQFSLPDGEGTKDKIAGEVKTIQDRNGSPALEVTLDATHGGYVNKNYAFYKSDGQQKSFKSFFTPFPKPVLTEHDDGKDPIGRVSDAEYIPIVDTETGRPKSKIRLKTLVLDPQAIQKVLDGRYMTVSISGRPKTSPICSICEEKAGMFGCKEGHLRGQTYDGKVCHLIFDEIEYSEVSFVNKPADQSGEHAAAVVGVRVVDAPSLDAEALKQYNEAVQKLKGQPVTADSEKSKSLVTCGSCKKIFDYSKVPEIIIDAIRCPHCQRVLDQSGKVLDNKDVEDKGLDNYLAEAASEGGHSHRAYVDPATGNGYTDYILGHGHNVVTKVVQPSRLLVEGAPAELTHTHKIGKKIAPLDSEDNGECDCEGVVFSDQERAEFKAIADANEDTEDATLTAAKRKGMKSATFCGPDRSYPVNDCSHGANAKARATQQVKAGKLSASAAAKVKACANRKMKSMGCGGSDALTTGSDIVDALIELVNDLKASYEADLESVKKTGKDALDAANAQVSAMKITVDTLTAKVTEDKNAHESDLTQISDLSKIIKEERSRNIVLTSLMLKKESFLKVFSGQKAEERAESFKNSLQDFRDISLKDLTIRQEELFAELTKQAFLQSAADELDPVLAGKVRIQQNKAQRFTSWIRGDKA